MPKILYNFACKSRIHKLFPAIENIISLSREPDYLIHLTLDVDDNILNTPEVAKKIKTYGEKVQAHWGISSGKVSAINRDVNLCGDFDILVNMSDDMVFTVEGFDCHIIQAMQQYFPDYDGFLFFHDGNQNRIATMTIEGKKYYDRFGYVYHPSYISVWCDNEANKVAQILGKYKYMGNEFRIMKHQHPLHDNQFKMDEQYFYTESFYEIDKANFFRRQAINFDIV